MTEPVVVERGVVFAEKDGYRFLELDVYRPAAAEGPLPVLHQVHGGGWRVSHRGRAPRETRGWTPSFFEQIATAGFVVFASSYRFSGEALFPAAVEDTIDAVRWIRANAHHYGADPNRYVTFGQSAGGYLALAAALALQKGSDPFCNGGGAVQGVVAWYPLTDPGAIADGDPAASFPSQWLGAPLSSVPDRCAAASLPAQVGSDSPPLLLIHGSDDSMAPFDQSVRVRDAYVAAGASVELVEVDRAEHFFGGRSDADVRQIFARTLEFAAACAG